MKAERSGRELKKSCVFSRFLNRVFRKGSYSGSARGGREADDRVSREFGSRWCSAHTPSVAKQIDCLAEIGEVLGNTASRLWTMRNGYSLPNAIGLNEIDARLAGMSESDLDALRSKLKIGLQWDTQVTLDGCEHLVTQAYCSALPVAYSG